MGECERIRDLLSFYVEKSIDQASIHEIEVHLEKCGECGNYYESLRDVIVSLSNFPEIEPEEELIERILTSTSLKGVKKAPRYFGFPYRIELAFSLLLIFLVVYVPSPRKQLFFENVNKSTHIMLGQIEKLYSKTSILLDNLNTLKDFITLSYKERADIIPGILEKKEKPERESSSSVSTKIAVANINNRKDKFDNFYINI
ncbi:MAG: zf-HC2 domain-containing protein [Acidobacteriota bacterium]